MSYLYFYTKVSGEGTYNKMEKNQLVYTYSPTTAGTYVIAYSVTETGPKIDLAKTVTVTKEETPVSEYKIVPDIQSCYYNKISITFTIKNKDGSAVSEKTLTVYLAKTGEAATIPTFFNQWIFICYWK